MKKNTSLLALIIPCVGLYAQEKTHYSIPIVHDTTVQWVAEAEKVINLTHKTGAYSLKKWYLDKIRNEGVVAYELNNKRDIISTYRLSIPLLNTQDWLKGLGIELPFYKNPKEWFFVDSSLPADNYDRYKYRVSVLRYSEDSCCGCDDADAFRVIQGLQYRNGKFSINNELLSPLCARRTATPSMEWYPLCNVAYNDKADRKFPGPGKNVVLLNTDVVDYEFSRQYPSPFDTVLTVYQTDIGSLIYQDILKGKIKPVSIETGIPIPISELLTMNMASDTIPAYDDNDSYKITAYKVVQQERSAADLSRLRITQDFYFDFENERLYSIVRSVVIMQVVRFHDGSIRGTMPFCRLE